MAITNPLAAAVSNLMFWVPKNDVRNEKIMKEVGLWHKNNRHGITAVGLVCLHVPCMADARQGSSARYKIPVQAPMLCRGPAACKAV